MRALLATTALLCGCLDFDALQSGRGQPPSQTLTDAGPQVDLAGLPMMACKSGKGTPLNDRAVACQAVIAMTGDVTNSCGSGWTLCASNPTTPEACAAVSGGFYASFQRGMQLHVPPGPSLMCSWSGPGSDVDQRFIFGCGSAKTMYDSPVSCGGFARAILCRNGSAEGPTTWDCLIGGAPGDVDFANVTNAGEGGVLCCR